jgi:hypothetical protein
MQSALQVGSAPQIFGKALFLNQLFQEHFPEQR